MSWAVHGMDMIDLKVAESFLIYGAGTMGLLLAQLAKDSGASQVDMVERNPARHALAKRLAADRIAVSAAELEMPHGWDVGIDATALPPPFAAPIPTSPRAATFLLLRHA